MTLQLLYLEHLLLLGCVELLAVVRMAIPEVLLLLILLLQCFAIWKSLSIPLRSDSPELGLLLSVEGGLRLLLIAGSSSFFRTILLLRGLKLLRIGLPWHACVRIVVNRRGRLTKLVELGSLRLRLAVVDHLVGWRGAHKLILRDLEGQSCVGLAYCLSTLAGFKVDPKHGLLLKNSSQLPSYGHNFTLHHWLLAGARVRALCIGLHIMALLMSLILLIIWNLQMRVSLNGGGGIQLALLIYLTTIHSVRKWVFL